MNEIGFNRPGLGIVCILVAMTCISVNDMLIKQLSGDYPLHQMIFFRASIGLFFNLILVQIEGGWQILKTSNPGLHALRGVAIVFANMTFFAALAALPLADTTALFFIAPLIITLLSIPMLGEKVGPRRLAAVVIGFIGVIIMVRSELSMGTSDGLSGPNWVIMLPIAAAFGYALMQILSRKLGITSKASAMAVYIQITFISVSLLFWFFAGDGRYTEGTENPSLLFLFRAWRWPDPVDRWLFLYLGLGGAVIGYTISQAYRLADAATIAPFEYVALPLAVFWGWFIWGDWPEPPIFAGIALIMGTGIYVFLRERAKKQGVANRRPLRRH